MYDLIFFYINKNIMTHKTKSELLKIKGNPIKRFKYSTPSYFKKLIWLGGVIGTVSLGILYSPEEISKLMPEMLKQYAGYGVVFGYVMSLISAQTIDEKKIINKLESKEKE